MSEGRRRSFFVSGGTLPPDSASYIERSMDHLLLESLLAGRFCYVLNPRQLGKSSLSVHTIGLLRAGGSRTAFVDLTRIGGKNVTPEQWYSGIALEIGRELGCRKEAAVYWKEHEGVSYVQRLFGMIREVALSNEVPLVIFIDEIDATRSLPFDPDEFFAAIRECYNRRVSDPVLERLTFCLLGVAVPSDLVRNPAMTPFNIGERITLEDFTASELSAFATELGPQGKEMIARVHYWTGGHPFLSQSLCRTIVGLEKVEGKRTVDEVVSKELFDYKARDSNINLADVANIALHYGDTEPDAEGFRAHLLSVYERVLNGKEVFDDESNRAIVLLKLSGIVRSDGRRLSVRNRIYERVFDRKWIEEHMPEQELRRQLQSYRRGAWRTAIVGGAILAVVGAVAAFAWYSRLQAVAAEERLNYELYVADMNSLRQYYDNGDTGRIKTILNRHRHSRYRGFEWGYWLGRYHDSPEEYTIDYQAPGKRVEGRMSADGREVCVVDVLSGTSTIIDRRSRKVVATGKIGWPRNVTPLRSRWIEIEMKGTSYDVRDIVTGRRISTLGDPNRAMRWYMSVEHSNLIATGEGDRSDSSRSFINVWNAETGKKVFGITNPWKGGSPMSAFNQDAFNISKDERYIMYQRGPLGPVPGDRDKALRGEAIVHELATGKVVDRFPVDSFNEVATKGFEGRWLFLQNRGRWYIRDVWNHRTTEWRPDIGGDWQLLGAMLTGDFLVCLLDGGRCVVRDLSGKQRDSLRENVFTIAAGSKPGEFIASSNSVRIYDSRSSATASVIASGRRVTRYEPGVLNLFTVGDPAITRVKEATLEPLGTVPGIGDASNYTYSGRWYLRGEPPNGPSELVSADGKLPSVKLPFRPTIWSAGRSEESIVIWRHNTPEIVAWSGSQKKARWRRPALSGLNSMWVNPEGTRLFVGYDGRQMAVLDMADGRVIGGLNAHNYGPVHLAFSADNRRVFTCGGDGAVVMWDVKTLKQLQEFRGNDQDGMTSADISYDGRRVVTTTRSGSWQLWDVKNGVQLLDVHVSSKPLTSATFGENGHVILTAGEDDRVRAWRSVDFDPTTYIPIDPSYLKDLHR